MTCANPVWRPREKRHPLYAAPSCLMKPFDMAVSEAHFHRRLVEESLDGAGELRAACEASTITRLLEVDGLSRSEQRRDTATNVYSWVGSVYSIARMEEEKHCSEDKQKVHIAICE